MNLGGAVEKLANSPSLKVTLMLFSRAFRFAFPALLVATALGAQQQFGRVEGLVVDAATKRPVADAGVQIVGTTLGTMTHADGRFSIANVPMGTVTIQVRRLGYMPRTITGLTLAASETLTQTVEMSAAVVRVAAQVVTASANRGSVESALDEQRRSNQIQSSVTAEQISKSPDSDAAQAAQRVSGVTVQDGRYVFVRGLGERYTTTSLNGARMPSPEPERKVVPLDLFPSGMLQSVTTSKSFTPDLSGDFSGAAVDIRTREYPAQRTVSFGSSIGMTAGTLGNRVAVAPGVGGELFALSGSGRDMPAAARSAGNFNGVSRAQKNAIINSFRDVWRPEFSSGRPNASFRASLGGNDRMLGRRIGYLLSGTYSYSQELRENEVRAQAQPGSEPNTQLLKDQLIGSASSESVLWGALLNAGTLLSANSRLTFNAIYNRTADNDARLERGFFSDAGPVDITRLDYVERSMWSTQLSGEHDFGRRALEWSIAGAGVTRVEPDKSELIYNVVPATASSPERLLWDQSSAEGAVRSFSTLDEKSIEGKVSHRWDFGPLGKSWSLKVGALGRGAVRDANNQSFGLFAPVLSDTVRALPPEEIFGGRFTAPDSAVIDVRSLAQGGSYRAEDALGAGFAMIDVPLSQALRLITGARLEYAHTYIEAFSTLGDRVPSTREFTDPLPAVVLTYRPSELQTVRLSGSRTLARPEYRELAAVRSRQVSHGIDLSGNPNLVRTLIDNVDLRWELYPRPAELVSVAVFAKRFHNPIERVSRASSNADFVTYVNTPGADNYGVELEARQGLDVLADVLAPFTASSSVTVMRSKIDLGSEGTAASTNRIRAMVGQAPYVVNVGLTYARGTGSATVLYNRVGPRIVEAGTIPMPDVKELARNQLDFSLRLPARRGILARFDAKNLLNTDYHVQQGSVVREFYHNPRKFQLGVTVER